MVKRRPAVVISPRLLCCKVSLPECFVREYIKNQEEEDKRLQQLNLWR